MKVVCIGIVLIFRLTLGAHAMALPLVTKAAHSEVNLSIRVPGPHIQRAAGPLISAHRGASRLAPENTLAAFQKAMEMGCDFIEVDVRTTADGKQICLHDASLKRTTGVEKNVRDISFDNLRGLSAGAWFAPEFAREKVPSLEEVCRLVASHNRRSDHKVNLYVDCKDIRAEEVVRLLQVYALLRHAVFYGDGHTLAEIRRVAPGAQLMPPYPGSEKLGEVMDALTPFAFDVRWSDIDAGLVANCHRLGIKVFSDLLDGDDAPAQYRKAIQLGVDLIQTDDIMSVKKCLEEYQKKETK